MVYNKKILVIAFKFPPYHEVGAYRWAQFAKNFADKGYILHIITVNWKNKKNQSWNNDIIHKNIFIHKIPSLYFHNLKYHKFSSNVFGWILSKLRNQLLKLSYIFYFVDEAQFWGKEIIPFAKKLIKKENIKYVIATGGPFMSNYWAAVLKKNIPEIKLIQDLRDEWNETRKFLKKSDKKKSYQYEEYALNNCNALVTTSIGLKELFSKKIKNKSVKQYIIYNGYDEQKIKKNIEKKKINKKRDFSFIYAGSLNNNRDKVLNIFLNVVEKNIKKLKDIKIFIYTSDCKGINKKYQGLIKKNHLIIDNIVSQDRLFELIRESFITLHFIPESQNYIVSIKLFEYGILNRPVLSINAGGDSEYLINKHKLGYSIKYNEENKIIKIILDLYKIWKKNPNYNIKPIGLEKYSYKKLSEEYLKIINSL